MIMLIFLVTLFCHIKSEQATGVRISANGQVLANNSYVTDTKTEVISVMVCHTDKPDCCLTSNEGNWYLIESDSPITVTFSKEFNVTRSDQGTISFSLITDSIPIIIGTLCCNIPDASGVNQTLCIHLNPLVFVSGATPIVGENYTLFCNASGISISQYHWEKDGIVLPETGSILFFLPLRLSHAGRYSCNTNQSNTDNKEVTLSIPAPDSLILMSNKPSPIWPVGSDVSLACIVKLNPTVVESDLPLLMVDVQLSRDGTPLALTTNTTLLNGTTFIYTTQLSSFGRSDSGNYTCTATVRPKPTVTYLSMDHLLTVSIILSTGVYLSVNGVVLANNSEISIIMIGEEANKALLCFTDLHQFFNETSNTVEDTGQWYFPNGSAIETNGLLYVSRGLDVVRLHRRNNVMMPTGVFVCEIPDASGTNQSIYIRVSRPSNNDNGNIVLPIGISVSIAVLFLSTSGVIVTLFGIHVRHRRSKGDRAQPETSDSIQMEPNEAYATAAIMKMNQQVTMTSTMDSNVTNQ